MSIVPNSLDELGFSDLDPCRSFERRASCLAFGWLVSYIVFTNRCRHFDQNVSPFWIDIFGLSLSWHVTVLTNNRNNHLSSGKLLMDPVVLIHECVMSCHTRTLPNICRHFLRQCLFTKCFFFNGWFLLGKQKSWFWPLGLSNCLGITKTTICN